MLAPVVYQLQKRKLCIVRVVVYILGTNFPHRACITVNG